jgi:hypothetical protein
MVLLLTLTLIKPGNESTAILTKKSEFHLGLNRIYFCSLKMYIRSDSQFNVKIELIDEIDEEVYQYSKDESSAKASNYAYLREIYKEKRITNYFLGDNSPLKGTGLIQREYSIRI